MFMILVVCMIHVKLLCTTERDQILRRVHERNYLCIRFVQYTGEDLATGQLIIYSDCVTVYVYAFISKYQNYDSFIQ